MSDDTLSACPAEARPVLARRQTINGRACIVIDAEEATHAQVVRAMEAEYFALKMEQARGNKSQAARLSGLIVRTFFNRTRGLDFDFAVSPR